MKITTKELQNNLKYCYGVSTVQVINNFDGYNKCLSVYHYGVEILRYYPDIKTLNLTEYSSYSKSTSRVRNKAIELITGYTGDINKKVNQFYYTNITEIKFFDYTLNRIARAI